jgi:predicted ATPase
MRIHAIHAKNIPPVENFEVENLSDLVVIAGSNGVGKTRLISSLLQYLQNFNNPNIIFIIVATDKTEESAWNKKILNTSDANDIKLLKTTLQQNRLRRNFVNSILYYESDRSIQKIKPYAFTWDTPDPWVEQVSWNIACGGLQNRFQDTLHAIFKKIQNQKTSIASTAIKLKNEGYASMNLDFLDPLEPFKEAFFQLLGPKTLEKADVTNQTLYYSLNGNTFDINTLSSGEREVLNITFDFILRKPSHCIIFFDEPELHLHPELSHKLISTLKTVGKSNQFILCTHSPDIISSTLDDSVIFISPPKNNGANQAILVKADDETNDALQRLGHSIGIVSLGKKIVLIEGNDSSLDKQTYTHLLKNRFSNLVLLPSAGKSTIKSFHVILSQILDRSIWGVQFFMLADRDALPSNYDSAKLVADSKGRFESLSKYHLENYFLDENILSAIFKEMEPPESWLCDPLQIRNKLREIARSRISYATALIASKYFRESVGNLDIMPDDCHSKSLEDLSTKVLERRNVEQERIVKGIEGEQLKSYIENTYNTLLASLDADSADWKNDIPGKQIFKIFCSDAKIQEGRLKTLYIKKAEEIKTNPFQEIIEIFRNFEAI